ncbi:MAG: tripartite tricarboxylate transporter permease [Paracoccaceae bacterium]
MNAATLGAALELVATWQSIAALAVGLTAGVIGGAIPGMSATMAVAIALPFTFALEPITGILLLLGVYKGGIFGGSIPAILIKTPGTPASSATTLDGYPMAERGEAGRALGIALYASCIADLVSNLALILFAGWLASFALSFRPPEFFTLILFSLTVIAGVSGDSLLKGIASAVLGLLVATIGLDLVYGTERFVFGEPNLMGGLNFIAVLVGLFALPEVFAYVYAPGETTARVRAVAGTRASRADLARCLPTILRGSLIGVVMGSIPGIGAAPSAFLSYSEARRTSRHRANFGKGEIEGVAAAEAGNNGVAGATLIPLLALGVPGDVITAIIIGAFMVHGLQPGPLLFATNGALIYAIFIGLVLSSALLMVIGGAATRVFRYIADVPKAIVMPSVLVLSVFGVYAVNNATFDIGVMFATGALGYAMLLLGVPAAPFLIAFILGPLLEDSFRQSMLMSGSDPGVFFESTIAWIFWTLTAVALAAIVFGLRRR